jgi:Protein of unknown function (DUF3422)
MSDRPVKLHFRRHEYYDDLMGGARRKPALPIAGPAVTRHVAFFYPNYPGLKREIWVDRIEAYILALYYHLKNNKYAPYTRSLKNDDSRLHLLDNSFVVTETYAHNAKPIRQRASRYQTFRVRFYYGQMPVSVSVELHDEYFTISTIMDLAWPPHDCDSHDTDCITTNSLIKAIGDFATIAGKRLTHTGQTAGESGLKQRHQADFTQAYQFIYETIWERFHEAIFEQPLKMTENACKCELGGIFADFRGFIAAIGDKNDFINIPGSHVSKYSLKQRIGEGNFTDAEAVHYADVLLPWLKADKGFAQEKQDTEPDRTEPVEFTVSLLLRQRALFASALGAQLSRIKGEQGPVTYTALCKNTARWQAGRLIDRIHMLGTLRIAALYNLPHLIQADNQLRELEGEIKTFVSPLPEQSDDLEDEQPEQAGKLEEKVRGWLQRFDGIERQAEKGKAQIIGGLAYRVERSGYYQSQFKEHWDGFRVDRIEGFAPLDEAVNRRLAGDYELIRTVAEHHRRLQEALASLGRRLQQDTIAKETRTIEKLQRGAETGFFAVLFPYYVSHVLIDAVERSKLAEAEAFSDANRLMHFDILILVASTLVGLTLAFYRTLRAKLTVPGLLFSLVVTILLLSYAGSHLKLPTAPPAHQPAPPSEPKRQ